MLVIVENYLFIENFSKIKYLLRKIKSVVVCVGYKQKKNCSNNNWKNIKKIDSIN